MECADGTSHKCFGNKGRDYTGEPDMHAGTGRGVYEGGGEFR